jgi:hypothetical protein
MSWFAWACIVITGPLLARILLTVGLVPGALWVVALVAMCLVYRKARQRGGSDHLWLALCLCAIGFAITAFYTYRYVLHGT